MSATDSVLKSFGNVWKFRKSQGKDLAWKAYGHLAAFVPEKAIFQSIIRQCSEPTRSRPVHMRLQKTVKFLAFLN